MEAKRRLRRELLTRRRAIATVQREAAGQAVASLVLALPEIASAPRVALYAALPDELPTRPCFDALAALRCERLLPRAVGDALEFVEVRSWEDLRPDALGVPSPPAGGPAVGLRPGDVALVPGVAFDAAGNRLGRGGGHYDRAFAEPGPFRVGIGFQLQLVPRVPHDSRDRPMDAIVTELGLQFRTGGS